MSEWAKTEIDKLVKCKRDYSGYTWDQIAQYVGRSEEACRKKWRRIRSEVGKPEVEFSDLSSPEVDLDEWLDQLESIQTLTAKAKPAITSANVKIKTKGMPIAFSPVGCMHLGGLYTNYPGFRERFNRVLKTERFYVGMHGDDIEGFPPGWAATVFNNAITPEMQKAILEKLVEKLADSGKMLYSMWGNHEAFHERLTGENPTASVFWNNGIPYFSSRGILKLHVDDVRYVFDVAHSFPGRSKTNPNHAQAKEFKEFPFADLVISAHWHQYSYQEFHTNSLAYETGFVNGQMARLISIGTAKTGLDPYTNRLGHYTMWNFDSWPVLVFSAKKHAIHRVHDYEALNWYLARDDF